RLKEPSSLRFKETSSFQKSLLIASLPKRLSKAAGGSLALPPENFRLKIVVLAYSLAGTELSAAIAVQGFSRSPAFHEHTRIHFCFHQSQFPRLRRRPSGADEGAGGIFREQNPADPGGQLLQVPLGRERQGEGRT